MVKILLTSDRTLMSNYHNNEFLGFGTCAPPNFLPERLYSYLFFPSIKTKKGLPQAAPYGLRKAEAQLLKEGFDVVTVSPEHLHRFIGDAKVLGIHVMDPFGLGPASTTLAFLFKKEPYLAKHFKDLLRRPEILEAKKRGLKIIVGGPGVWQFQYRSDFAAANGIDCIVEGEAEKTLGSVFSAALNDEPLSPHHEISVVNAPHLGEIPDIVFPSVNGLVEIGRGCCRGCEFCNVTLRPLRWYPLEKIMREIDVNLNADKNAGCCLHGEDVMLYGSNNVTPNEEKLLELHEAVMKKTDNIAWSHCSLAAVASKPQLFAQISEIIRAKQTWWGAEIGIETGSAELAKKIMPAKALPFKAEEWPEVVKQGMGIMHDNLLVPAGTLIVGLPEEREEDLLRTMDMMDDLKDCRSLIVPLFFVPLGKLKNLDWFKDAELTDLHRRLLIQCGEHDFKWMGNLMDMAFKGKWYSPALKGGFKMFAYIAKRKARQKEQDVLSQGLETYA
ncbi:MAG: B12-binding domain-containing radical SAM protein [Candidatus Bathyarchaeota archaeon]|nr:B12-binding domain-containing radical SAM protein [Candidatus Bathyarchaeota archaeon]